MAILCKDVHVASEVQHKYKNVYKYEVLGGLHTFMAKVQLAQRSHFIRM